VLTLVTKMLLALTSMTTILVLAGLAGYSGDRFICNDINECDDFDTCSDVADGSCVNNDRSFICACNSGYVKILMANINKCETIE
jgi:hypothetical protein